jgi:adenosylhomocysteine nucleosidase
VVTVNENSRCPYVIVMATALEARPFIKGLSMHRCRDKPFKIYRNDDFLLTISGIGKVNAARAAAYSIEQFQPASLYNLGAAGAADFSHPLGAVYLISRVIEFDRIDPASGSPLVYTPSLLPGLPAARIATLDSPVQEPSRRQEIAACAELIDMESAAIVQACLRFKIPCYILKFVSDTPEHTSQREIIDNIRSCRVSLYQFCLNRIFSHMPMP